VHIRTWIHGIGDLPPEIRDWRNPVARVTIRRVNQSREGDRLRPTVLTDLGCG